MMIERRKFVGLAMRVAMLTVFLMTVPSSFAGEVETYTTPGELTNTLDSFQELLVVEQTLLIPVTPPKAPAIVPSQPIQATNAPKAEEGKTAPEAKSESKPATSSRVGETTPAAVGRTDLQAGGPAAGGAAPTVVDYKDLSLGELGSLGTLNQQMESVSARSKRVDKSLQSIGGLTAEALGRNPSQNPKVAALKEGLATSGLSGDRAPKAGFGDTGELTFPNKPGAAKALLPKGSDDKSLANAKNKDAAKPKTKEEKEKEKEEAERKREKEKEEFEQKKDELANTKTPYKQEDYDKFREFISNKLDDLKNDVKQDPDSKFAQTAQSIFDMFSGRDLAKETQRPKSQYADYLDAAKAAEPFQNPIVLLPTPVTHQGGPIDSRR